MGKSLKNLRDELIRQYTQRYETTYRNLEWEKLRAIANDPLVRTALSVIKFPIVNSQWEITSEDEGFAEIIDEELNRTWLWFVDEALRALEYGFCALEKVWDAHDGLLSIRKWNEAEQWRVKILVNSDGDFRGFRYYTQWGAPINIPPEKAFVWAYNSEYGNLYGTPYTASIYSLWIAKETIMLDVLRFYEKWGGLNVVVKYPPRPVLDDEGNVVKDENQDTAEEIGQTLRSNSIITMPNEVDANGNPIWQIEEYLSSTKDKGADYREFLTYLDKRILLGLLVPDQVLLEGKYGSYALYSGRQNLLAVNIEGIRELLKRAMKKYWLDKFAEYNFGAEFPEYDIKFAPISDADRDFLQEIYKQAVSLGYITDDIVKGIEERLNLPREEKETTPPPSVEPEQQEGALSLGLTLATGDKVHRVLRQKQVDRDKRLNRIYRVQTKTAVNLAYKPLEQWFVEQARKAKSFRKLQNITEIPTEIQAKMRRYYNSLFAAFQLFGSAEVMLDAAELVNKQKRLSFASPMPPKIYDTIFWQDITPDEAVDYFRGLVPLQKEEFERILETTGQYAFTVTGYESEYALRKWQQAITKAIEEGWSLETFQRYVETELFERAGLTVTNPYHIETVFRTNLSTAYNAGKWQVMEQNDFVRQIFPYYRYTSVLDANTRPEHAAMDGHIAPIDDPIWDVWTPPCGYNCRCSLELVSKWDDVEPSKELPKINGKEPQPDPGFAHNPAKRWLEGNYLPD